VYLPTKLRLPPPPFFLAKIIGCTRVLYCVRPWIDEQWLLWFVCFSILISLLPKKRKLNIGLQNLKNNRLLGHSFCFQDAGNLAA
jgi:hypothetical protein